MCRFYFFNNFNSSALAKFAPVVQIHIFLLLFFLSLFAFNFFLSLFAFNFFLLTISSSNQGKWILENLFISSILMSCQDFDDHTYFFGYLEGKTTHFSLCCLKILKKKILDSFFFLFRNKTNFFDLRKRGDFFKSEFFCLSF